MNTRFSRSSLNFLIMASVNVSHPLFRCEPVWWARTVRTEFIGNTPWLTQRSKFPEEGIGFPRSSWISLNIFIKEPGIATPSGTEKQTP